MRDRECPYCAEILDTLHAHGGYTCFTQGCRNEDRILSERQLDTQIENALDDAFERASVRALADGGGASASYLADMRDSGRGR